jgi:CHAT domain-containing protein
MFGSASWFSRAATAPKILLAGLAASALLTGCQPSGQKTLSIEEAKQVTAEFEGRSFVPPPRTVEDVLAFLQLEDAEAEARRAEWLRTANTEPPTDAGTKSLVDFYNRRAGVKGFLGRTREQIADLERAETLAQGRRDDLSNIYQGLGVAHVHVGDFRRGLEYRKKSTALIDPKRTGAVIGRNANMSGFLAYLGDFSAAGNALQKAWSLESRLMSQQGGREWVGMLRAFLRSGSGWVAMNQGKYVEAEGYFREGSRFLLNEIEAGTDVRVTDVGWPFRDLLHFSYAFVQRGLALSLIQQGRLIEAEIAARSAVDTAVGYFGRRSIISAEVIPSLGLVLLEQGRAVDAERINREAVAIYREMEVPGYNLFYNKARAGLAESLAAQGRWPEVMEIYREIERGLSDDPDLFDNAFAASASWAIAEIASGNAATTAARLTPALARQVDSLGDKHLVTAETRGLLAAALIARGDTRRALPMFEQSFDILASNSRGSAEEGVTQAAHNQRISFILEAYIEALAAGGMDDPSTVDRSLRVAGLAHGRTVQQAVLAAAARSVASDPVLADLVRREQDARKQIAALNGTLANIMSTPAARRETSGEEQVRVQIANLRNARASLAQEIETRFPDYAALINPKPPGVAETQAALASGEALIVTYVGERASYVWGIPKSGPALFRRVARNRGRVLDDVGRLRRALDPNAEILGDIPDFDVALAHQLYQSFLAPIRTAWQSAETLLVVADGPLGQLPPGLLVTEQAPAPKDQRLLFDGYKNVPWLARDHAIAVLPSAASLTALRALPPNRPGRRSFVGFGDPVFRQAATATLAETIMASESGQIATRGRPVRMRSLPRMRGLNSAQLAMLPPLPDTADEIKSIARALDADPTRDVFLGRAANERQVKTANLADYRVVAFATHGLVPGDLDGLAQPALALSAPPAPSPEDDGLLTMEEILSLRLDADWVVLSACNTGTAQGAGAEAVSGLGRAFFYAGTRALLVSNWPVETTSAKVLTTDIFRRQAEQPGLSRAQALQDAIVDLMEGPGFIDARSDTAIFSYAHPIFWAPFTLVGDGGAARPGA